MIAEKYNVLEAVCLEAARRGVEKLCERRVRQRDRAREAHVTRWRVHASFGDVGDHRRHERVAQAARDGLGEQFDPHIVFAEHHVRSILFGAPDWNENCRLSGMNLIAELRPGKLFQ